MIRRIWIRIIWLLTLAVVPATLLQLHLQKESVDIVYDLADSTGVRQTLDQCLSQIKEAAKARPELEESLRGEFMRTMDVKRGVESFFMARSSIDQHLRLQTAVIVVTALLISIFGSLWISRGIVKHVHSLMTERERAQAKIRDLESLKSWQRIARTLVHELRAPLTPIQLIASDLDAKFDNLDHEALGTYLRGAQSLLNDQVRSIEAMISSFTAFGRLPPPELQPCKMAEQVKNFVTQYDAAFGSGVSLDCEIPASDPSVLLDPKLFRDLLYNLVKNAVEANHGETRITFQISESPEHAFCLIKNTGVPIPGDLSEKLFEPYVSSKAGSDSSNMGLGLTICRKTALDHGGDLRLVNHGVKGSVTFKLELPRANMES